MRFLGRPAHVHNMAFNPHRPAPMLVRANRDFEAKQAALPPVGRTPLKAELAKQLFPSSSPSMTQNGNIENLLKNPRQPSSSTLLTKTATSATDPLKQRSTNIPCSGPGTTSFASLYNQSNSFQDEVINLVDEDSQDLPGKTVAGVYFGASDFDSDEDLDLSYEAPSALPPLPQNHTPKVRFKDPLPATNTSALSWSQSSPSHYLPPQSRVESRHRPAKRESLDDASTPIPVAKKRILPKDWHKREEEELDESDPLLAATPISKQAPWDATASAVKAQKKQLKNQQKKPARDSEQIGMDEIQEVVNSHHAAAKTSAISLSNEQRHVKSLVVEKNQSVFFTGPAGTGKSVLMRSIIQDLKKKYVRDPERVAVTASTGLAACNIGGMTLHSFAGIGLGKEDAQALVKKIRRNPKAKNRWLRTKALIIDEISMVDGDLFDKLSQIGRIIRNNGRPWGGIQLVITGDFFQLPPVPDASKQRETKFAFEAATWNTSIDHTIGLTEVFRQRDPGKLGARSAGCQS